MGPQLHNRLAFGISPGTSPPSSPLKEAKIITRMLTLELNVKQDPDYAQSRNGPLSDLETLFPMVLISYEGSRVMRGSEGIVD